MCYGEEGGGDISIEIHPRLCRAGRAVTGMALQKDEEENNNRHGLLSHRTGKYANLAKLGWLREPKIFILPLKLFLSRFMRSFSAQQSQPLSEAKLSPILLILLILSKTPPSAIPLIWGIW